MSQNQSIGVLPWIVAVGFFMQALDMTILNTALPTMAQNLGESPLRMQSLIVSYALTVALLIPASGWLSDRFGTQRVFFTAIVLFSFGSLLCALSSSLNMLIVSRIIQGMGGALLLPVGRLAILRSVPRDQLLQVLSFVVIPGLIGPLLGPTLGGWLVEVASWHWVFLINIPVGIIGCIATWRYMPNLKGDAGKFDLQGFVLIGSAMVLVSLALQGLGEKSLSLAVAMLLLVAGLAFFGAYWLYAARTPRPLFGLNLFRIHSFSVGIIGNLFARLGSGGMPYLLPLFLQLALGFSPLHAGMLMIPTALGAMTSKVFVNRLVKHFGYQRVLVINTLIVGGLIASYSLIGKDTPTWWLCIQFFVFGIFNSIQFSAMNTVTLKDLGDDTASSGNSLLSVMMQLSVSLGVAMAAALLAAFTEGRLQQATVIDAFHSTYICIGLIGMVAASIFFQLDRNTIIAEPKSPAADET
ncbi:multidrug transporter subunit MdtD [Cellvibrio sp. NN19]|uniref:multidrug transporter subunit MdtD n=1 Tax=Cellvibrio chitinivorans TaxID=3102792 RepID=UPI002B40ECB3|nr:multidrug transporter subunit MdtD [Cellvibrio sp. NN19]